MLIYNIVYGGAGTGKTTRLVNDVSKLKKDSYVILSPTHSSLKNLQTRLNDEQKSHSRTLYSYFQIDYEHDHVVGPISFVKHIFVDEFGLIKKELLKQIINKTSIHLNNFIMKNRLVDLDVFIHLYGDPVQLSPIYTEKRYISFNKLAKFDGLHSYVIEHYYNSPFSLTPIVKSHHELLKVNHRANDKVIQIVQRLFYDNDLSVIQYINQLEVVRLIVNEGYVFISSTYELQASIYKLVCVILEQCYSNTIYFNKLLFYNNAKFIVAETTSKRKNGEILTFDHHSDGNIYLKDEDGIIFKYDSLIKLLPEFLITAHKSQGLTIPKVIVCVDNLFDVSMLYTMITRASEDVKFYKVNDVKLNDYITKFRDILHYYGYIDL